MTIPPTGDPEGHGPAPGAAEPVAAALHQVGPRLRRVREHRGLTLAKVAEQTGISTSTLSRLEAGRRKPSLELLLPLARSLACRSTISSALRRSGIPGSASRRAR